MIGDYVRTGAGHRREKPVGSNRLPFARHVRCVFQDPFLFSVLARKEKRFLDSKEKRALMRVSSLQKATSCPQLSDCLGATVESAVAPVSARSRFAWRCMVQKLSLASRPSLVCRTLLARRAGAALCKDLRAGSAASVSEAFARKGMCRAVDLYRNCMPSVDRDAELEACTRFIA